MTNERFEELVNLYLDAEIGRRELDELKRTVGENALRRQQFERACQLHQAARKALVGHAQGGGEDHAEADSRSENRDDESAGSSRSHRSGRHRSRSHEGSQRRAQVNAAVSTMVERQTSQGAAASVRLVEGKRGSGSKVHRTSGAGHLSKSSAEPSAAGNPLGWVIALLGLGCVGLTTLVLLNPEAKNNSGLNDGVSFAVGERPSVPDKLPGFSKDGELESIGADEAFRARLLAAALAGNSVSRQFQVNILAARPEHPAEPGAASVFAVDVTQTAVLAPGPSPLQSPGAASWSPAAGNPDLLPIPPLQGAPPSGPLAVPPAPPAGQPAEILQQPPVLAPPPAPLPASAFETPPPTTVSPLAEP